MPARKKSSRKTTPRKKKPGPAAESYRHREEKLLTRPEVGTQAQFRKKKPPVK